MKIMIIDDESDICFIIGFELKSLGHETQSFTTAEAAKEQLTKELPDAIICDFQMPKTNGLDFFRWMKSQGINIPFYILTGEPNMDRDSLIQFGIVDILQKPQDLLRLSKIFK